MKFGVILNFFNLYVIRLKARLVLKPPHLKRNFIKRYKAARCGTLYRLFEYNISGYRIKDLKLFFSPKFGEFRGAGAAAPFHRPQGVCF